MSSGEAEAGHRGCRKGDLRSGEFWEATVSVSLVHDALTKYDYGKD